MATTNNNDVPIKEKLTQLFNLQKIDSKIDEIGILKGELPMEVKDLEDEIAGLNTRARKLRENIEDMENQENRHKANIVDSEALIEKYTKQMDNVKNNREYEALTKELELQKLEIQLSEKKIREIKGQYENKNETLRATEARLEQKNKDLEAKKVELEKIIIKTEKDEEKLLKQSVKAKKNIDDRLIKAYTKIRNSYRNGLAVVSVSRNSCGGCFNKIPPQLQLEIKLLKKVIACEHCGRILIDQDTMDADENAMAVENAEG